MSKPSEVVGVAVADLHLSHRPSLARSNESNWYRVMERYLDQVNKLASKYRCPVMCAGDIFDTPTVPMELIVFAIKHLDGWAAIPGNHELPNHRIQEMPRSAFGVLVEAGVLRYIRPDEPFMFAHGKDLDVCLHGFPWGIEVEPCRHKTEPGVLHIAMVHDFIWIDGKGYTGAAEVQRADHWKEKLQGYDCAIFGDNHSGFTVPRFFNGKGSLFNCGGFMRRRSDERTYHPQVGLIYSDGTIKSVELDVSEDQFISTEHDAVVRIAERLADGLLSELRDSADNTLNFDDAVRRWAIRYGKKTPKNGKLSTLVLELLEGEK